MLIFLSGEGSQEEAKTLADEFGVFYKDALVYCIDEDEENATRTAISFFNAYTSNLQDMDDRIVLIFSSRGEWFLERSDTYGLDMVFETLGGVMFTDGRFSYDSVDSREAYRSFQREAYTNFPRGTRKQHADFVWSYGLYGEDRARSLIELAHDGYVGEVMGNPKTIFVLPTTSEVDDDPEDQDMLLRYVNFVLGVRQYMVPEHGNHIGIVTANTVSDIQEAFPYSVFVAIGSFAWEFIQKYIDEDILKAAIPDPKGLRSADWDFPEDTMRKFARLVENVVESQRRVTSLLQLQ